MASDLEKLFNDFKKLSIEMHIEYQYEDAFILDYLSPVILGAVEIFDTLKICLLTKNVKLSDQDKNKMFIISSMVSILKASGKCGKKYLENLDIIAASGNTSFLDPMVIKILNNIYLKFHILIPKDPIVKGLMIIFINGGLYILKKIYNYVKINYLNNFVYQKVHKLDRKRCIKNFDMKNKQKLKLEKRKKEKNKLEKIKKIHKIEIELKDKQYDKNDYIEFTPILDLNPVIDF